jgi:5-methylcytosine-specific restriction endonuclease McrA
MLNRDVLVLNHNYEPLSITRARRAVVMMCTGKAEVVERHDGLLVRSPSTALAFPSVVRLSSYVKVYRRAITLSRRNIVRRDGHRCQYCGTSNGPMTTDHVIPKTMGGKDTWENMVCACVRCNNRKGNCRPEEMGMKLLRPPTRPHFFTFTYSNLKVPDERWRPYLFLE